MNFFFDTEFIEGPQPKKILGLTYGKTKPIIDLISIGIVDENGSTYYAISKEFNFRHAWNDEFIRENVLSNIFYENAKRGSAFNYRNTKKLIRSIGKANITIAAEILMFCFESQSGEIVTLSDNQTDTKLTTRDLSRGYVGSTEDLVSYLWKQKREKPFVFWDYYAATDWVAFYQLWGKLIDKPESYPLCVMCLKNLMEFKGHSKEWKNKHCPEPEEKHNALKDAIWNKKLYNSLIP